MSKSVLVLSDEPDTSPDLEATLAGAGWEVTVAGDDSKALESMASLNPNLVLIDVATPAPVVRRLKGEDASASTPVGVITRDHTDGAATECWEAGADLYLHKPVSAEELLHYVSRMVE